MPNQPLEPAEIQQCKGLMGYPNVLIQANPIIGTTRIFEDALQQYADDYLVGWIRDTFLPNMTTLETEMQALRTRFKIKSAGKFTQDGDEMRKYNRLWNFWLGEFEKKSGIRRWGRREVSSDVY